MEVTVDVAGMRRYELQNADAGPPRAFTAERTPVTLLQLTDRAARWLACMAMDTQSASLIPAMQLISRPGMGKSAAATQTAQRLRNFIKAPSMVVK